MESGREGSFSLEGDCSGCRVDIRGEEMEEESYEEEEEEMIDEDQVQMEIGMKKEDMETPSWVFIVRLNEKMRVFFSCLCNECDWKGEEETQLVSHLKGHVYSEYGMKNIEIEDREEGGDAEGKEGSNRMHSLFIACPVPFCNRAFSINAISSMLSHMSMHAHHGFLQKKGLIALKSKEEFANIQSCGNKEKLMSSHSGGVHMCMWDECDISFMDVNEFFSHVLSHMEYLCDNRCLWDSCTHIFKYKSRLIPHLKYHIGLKKGSCPFCGEVFSSFSKLFDHVSRRLEDENGLNGDVVCKLCRKSFPNEKSLRLHVKRHIVKFVCDECGVLFPTKHDLNRHCSCVHSNLRLQLACSFPNCTKRFASNAKLMQHAKLHTDERIKCPECSSEFRWVKQLTKHINLEHNKDGIPQYVCHVCNRHYEDGSSLTRHLKKKHEVAIPLGFPRFQYKKCEDGMFRLQTNRPFV